MAAAIPYVMAGLSVAQGVSGYNQGMYGAAVAEQNAKIAQQNADRAVQAGEIQAYDSDMNLRQVIGAQTAAQGASGLSVSGGSARAVRQSQSMAGSVDRQRIRDKAGLEAYNYRTQAADLLAQSKNSKMQASNALLSGFINAGTSIMGGSSSTSGKWGAFKSKPMTVEWPQGFDG